MDPIQTVGWGPEPTLGLQVPIWPFLFPGALSYCGGLSVPSFHEVNFHFPVVKLKRNPKGVLPGILTGVHIHRDCSWASH